MEYGAKLSSNDMLYVFRWYTTGLLVDGLLDNPGVTVYEAD